MKKYEIDMCNGSIFPKILAFSLPLMLTGILQLLFNAADIIVIGKFAGEDSLAAIGSTTTIVNFFVNIFMGLSVGTNVVVSTAFGAKDYKKIHKTVQTSIIISLILGVAVGILGFIFSTPILHLLKTPANIINKATIYLKIYFLGLPALMVYNYTASILRAFGDTKRPLYYLFLGGLINVALNLFLTINLKMDVAGVAIATVVSETFSMILILICIMKTNECYKYDIKEFKIYIKELFDMIRIGLPAAVNSSLFSISNMIIQSGVNSFGSVVVAGNSVSGSVEGFVYTSMDSVSQATMSFTGQNYGAKKYDRLNKILYDSIIAVTVIGLLMGFVCLGFSDYLFRIYTDSPAVMEAARVRAWVIMPTYFMCGIMNVFIGAIRGHGYTIIPTLISAVGILVTRAVWIFTAFRKFHLIKILYISWPISYIIVIIAFTINYIIVHNIVIRKSKTQNITELSNIQSNSINKKIDKVILDNVNLFGK